MLLYASCWAKRMIKTSMDIRKYTFCNKDRLFLDANIWLLIYGPVPRSDKDKIFKNIYSNSFKNMLINGAQIFVDELILSEFINAFRQLEFKRMKPEFEWSYGFKKFRDSPESVQVTKEIASNARKILKVSLRCDSIFNSANIDAMLNEYEKGHSDFNDQVYLELCKTNGFTFVTNDSDFKDCEVPLLTANSSLLK
jgi:predicted nucleic acid-binding protein